MKYHWRLFVPNWQFVKVAGTQWLFLQQFYPITLGWDVLGNANAVEYVELQNVR